jgi:hypothetical protein
VASIIAVANDIRNNQRGHFNDLEYLAQLIEDSTISDTAPGNELQSRLVTILEASSDGSGGGVTHFANILSRCGDRGFRDEFRDGSNQVGHFLTAVDMGFRPTKTGNYVRTVGLPEGGYGHQEFAHPAGTIWFSWDEQVCVRLIIGHEQVADTDDPDNQWYSNIKAMFTADNDEVTAFFAALNRVALGNADLAATKAALAPIKVGTGKGNSIMDLHLSLYGYQLGRFIRHGRMVTRRAAATWLRWNIGGTFAFVQRA